MKRCLATRGIAAAALAAIALASSPAAAAPPCGRIRVVALYDSHGLTPFGEHLDHALLGIPSTELRSITLGGASPSWLMTKGPRIRRPVSPRGYAFDSCEGKPLTPRSRLPQLHVRTPSLEDLLRVPVGTYERQIVVLTLGSNVPGEPWRQSAAVEQIVRTVNARPDTACVWVGPPSIRKWSAKYSDEVYAAIREGIHAAGVGRPSGDAACALVDSRGFTAYPPGGDGMHLDFVPSHEAVATRWAEAVQRAVERALPLGLAPPLVEAQHDSVEPRFLP